MMISAVLIVIIRLVDGRDVSFADNGADRLAMAEFKEFVVIDEDILVFEVVRITVGILDRVVLEVNDDVVAKILLVCRKRVDVDARAGRVQKFPVHAEVDHAKPRIFGGRVVGNGGQIDRFGFRVRLRRDVGDLVERRRAYA